MELSPLLAISPIDGRYRGKTEALSAYFSEFALIKYRISVEIEYFIALCQLPLPQLTKIGESSFEDLRNTVTSLSKEDVESIKNTEATINHDVKAVEYFLKDKLETLGLGQYKEFIHFGLTSQDVNNTAIPMALRDAMSDIYYPALEELSNTLKTMADTWKDIPMLAKTHGQPASPTRVGKEIMVFVERLNQQKQLLTAIPYSAKFGGTTGNFNAHHAAFPDIDWNGFADGFINDQLKLNRSHYTTQIDHYDHLAATFDGLRRINTILIDMCRDIWTYISMKYFIQKVDEKEVGSSTMPHKVNPIDFENAEGNFGMANGIFIHLSTKLPISRLQRDLTDSTVIRNIGVPIGHTMIGFQSLAKGLAKLKLNEKVINTDLENNWFVVAEAIQTVLRREGYKDPYEALKSLTRNNSNITKEMIVSFIDTLEMDDRVKEELKSITPMNYVGI